MTGKGGAESRTEGTTVLLVLPGSGGGNAKELLNGAILDVVTCAAREAAARISDAALDVALIAEGHRPSESLALLRKVKRERPDLPVIYLAAKEAPESAAGAYRAGARVCMARPVGPEELRETVAALAALRRSSRGRRAPFIPCERRRSHSPDRRVAGLPEGLRRVVALMRTHLAEPLSLDDLAAEAAMSKYHFCRLFRAHLGSPPHRYLASLRIARAKDLLASDETAVSQIASLVGFNDPGNFAKTFRRNTGLSPSAFRRAARVGQ